MKNFIFLFILGFTFLTTDLLAFNTTATAATVDTRCTNDSWFKYPYNNAKYDAGKDVYVRVDTRKYRDIAYVKLYINGHFIRKELNFPYEWGRPNSGGDRELRNLRPGNYKLTAIIKDKCGYQFEKCIFITVKPKHGGGNNNCHFNNPLVDFHWLKNLHNQFPNYFICQYKKNGRVFFRIYRDRSQNCYEYWYDCSGRLICKFKTGHNPPNSISHCNFVKCWYKCNDNTPKHCNFKFWFQKPNKQSFNKGEGVYVNVGTDNPSDIKYMELFVEGRSLGKESNAPYEWGKPNTSSFNFFRNLGKGTYKLTVIVVDHCGRSHKKHIIIVIKDNCNNHHVCNFKFWFKTIKSCARGRDIFVTVATDNHRDIEFMELYVNGRFVRKEMNYPYEWGKPNSSGDRILRNCHPGIYKLKVRVKSKCGKWYEKFWTVNVRNRNI